MPAGEQQSPSCRSGTFCAGPKCTPAHQEVTRLGKGFALERRIRPIQDVLSAPGAPREQAFRAFLSHLDSPVQQFPAPASSRRPVGETTRLVRSGLQSKPALCAVCSTSGDAEPSGQSTSMFTASQNNLFLRLRLQFSGAIASQNTVNENKC